MSTSSLISLAQNRRTIYKLGKIAPVQDADSKIEELVNEAILHVPSSFNTQSTRLVVLLHGEHDKLWDIAIEAFGGLVSSGKVSKEMWENQTLPKLKGFQAAYGTVCIENCVLLSVVCFLLSNVPCVVGPLLRRPCPYQTLPGEIPYFQGSFRALG
jgi:predicted oxidoreductase (fatty acid repression mutant protein)